MFYLSALHFLKWLQVRVQSIILGLVQKVELLLDL